MKQAIAQGHWPSSCPAELRAHVESCTTCRDLAAVTEAMLSARAVSVAQPQLPPAGIVWWRAQLRRRKEAVERINLPIWIAQIFAMSLCLLMVAGLLASRGILWSQEIGQWLKDIQHPVASITLLKLDWSSAYLIPAAVMLGLLGCLVVFLAADKQ
jgi:predicted anti-sigma-YlaC factor YlaD